MRWRLIVSLLCGTLVTGLSVPSWAQAELKEIVLPATALEPSGGDFQSTFSFRVRDVDPLANDGSGLSISCFLIQNLGSATATEVVEVRVLNGSVPIGSASTAAPASTTVGGCPPGAPAGGSAAFEAFIDTTALGGTFPVADDEEEAFTVQVKVAPSATLRDAAQGHTVALRVVLQFSESVGSPPTPTTFTPSIGDSQVDRLWNGGINEVVSLNFTPEPIRIGDSGRVALFRVCDADANGHDLKLIRLHLAQGPQGNARSSDLVGFELRQVSGTPTSLGSTLVGPGFDPGAGGFDWSLTTTIGDDACEEYELLATVAAGAMRGRSLQLQIRLSAEEPAGSAIDPSAEPTILSTQLILIGSGIVSLPHASIAGSSVPLQIFGFPQPGLGAIRVQTAAVQFDPAVIHVEDVQPESPYRLQTGSFSVDNRLGELRFVLEIDPTQTASAKTQGTVAWIVLSPQGRPGERSPLVFQLDRVTDAAGADLTGGVTVVSGSVTLLQPGDLDFDGAPTVRDALLLANAIVASDCDLNLDNPIVSPPEPGGLSDEQKKIADVAPPFVKPGETPTCQHLTSADVRQIARLAITFGIEAGGSPVVGAARAEDLPWWQRWLRRLFGPRRASVRAGLALEPGAVRLQLEAPVPLGGLQGRIAFDPARARPVAVRAREGYRLLAVQIDPALGEVRFVALASPGAAQEAVPLELVLQGDRADVRLHLSWVLDTEGNALPVQIAASPPQPFVPLRVTGLRWRSAPAGWQVEVLGQGVGETELEIYDLAGGRRFAQRVPGHALSWNGLDAQGRPLANGTYLVVVTVWGQDGTSWHSRVVKRVLLR